MRPRIRVGKPNRSNSSVAQPLRPRIVELGRGGLGELVGLLARQQPVEQVGHHQQRLGHVQERRILQLHRQQLIQRVELHELQAGVRKISSRVTMENASSIIPFVRRSR